MGPEELLYLKSQMRPRGPGKVHGPALVCIINGCGPAV